MSTKLMNVSNSSLLPSPQFWKDVTCGKWNPISRLISENSEPAPNLSFGSVTSGVTDGNLKLRPDVSRSPASWKRASNLMKMELKFSRYSCRPHHQSLRLFSSGPSTTVKWFANKCADTEREEMQKMSWLKLLACSFC